MRQCRKCKQQFPIPEFPLYCASGVTGRRHSCQSCLNKQHRQAAVTRAARKGKIVVARVRPTAKRKMIQTGQRFGLLTITGKSPPRITVSGNRVSGWNCICDCGMVVKVASGKLNSGRKTDCGHVFKERVLRNVGLTEGDTETRRKARVKMYAKKHAAKISDYHKDYRKQHFDTLLSRALEYQRKRLKTDSLFRMVRTLRCRMRSAIKAASTQKSSCSFELLGCSLDELRAHFEARFTEGMSWENYGRGGWVVDHVRPCASFNLANPDEQRACFALENLQPLWYADNMRKGANVVVLAQTA